MKLTIEREIIIANALHDKELIKTRYNELMDQRNKLDRWFDKFLDMFEEKLTVCESTDPVKRLYKTKSDEYEQVNRTIRIAEHYMKAQ